METDCAQRDRNSLIAFVHIPKTAGTTLNSMLARHYSPDELHEVMMRGMSWIARDPQLVPRPLISFSKIKRLKSALRCPRRLRVVHGHFDVSLLKLLPRDARCFTLLRDPVERAISHYYHYRRMAADPVHPLAMRSTLADWVNACDLVEMDNGQTRRLAGEMNLPFGRVSSSMLDRAKSNLAKFAVVGLTERFEESLILLHRAFHWPLSGLPARNVGFDRPRRAEVGEETLRTIEDRNRYDRDLYRFACELFERAIARVDLDRELARLRAPAAARKEQESAFA